MMKKKVSRFTALFLVAILFISSIVVAGCSSKTEPASTAGQNNQDSAANLESLSVLKLAAEDWAYVAEKKGWFQEAFDASGIKVELVQGYLGNEAQLMARNDLHFANRMLYPYLLYRSQGADLIAVEASVHPDPNIVSILVPIDSPAKTFDDLKGKKIASWRAGCPYMVLYEIAENKDWKEGQDWTYVNVPSSEIKTALLSKEIDAASAHLIGDVAALVASGSAREIAHPASDSIYVQGGGIMVTFTSSEFAKNNPNITKKVIEVKTRSQAWMLQNIDEAATIVESTNRVPADISKLSWERMGSAWTSEYDLQKIQTETEVMQNWLIEHGDIEAAKKVEVTKLFDPQFFKS